MILVKTYRLLAFCYLKGKLIADGLRPRLDLSLMYENRRTKRGLHRSALEIDKNFKKMKERGGFQDKANKSSQGAEQTTDKETTAASPQFMSRSLNATDDTLQFEDDVKEFYRYG